MGKGKSLFVLRAISDAFEKMREGASRKEVLDDLNIMTAQLGSSNVGSVEVRYTSMDERKFDTRAASLIGRSHQQTFKKSKSHRWNLGNADKHRRTAEELYVEIERREKQVRPKEKGILHEKIF